MKLCSDAFGTLSPRRLDVALERPRSSVNGHSPALNLIGVPDCLRHFNIQF